MELTRAMDSTDICILGLPVAACLQESPFQLILNIEQQQEELKQFMAYGKCRVQRPITSSEASRVTCAQNSLCPWACVPAPELQPHSEVCCLIGENNRVGMKLLDWHMPSKAASELIVVPLSTQIEKE